MSLKLCLNMQETGGLEPGAEILLKRMFSPWLPMVRLQNTTLVRSNGKAYPRFDCRWHKFRTPIASSPATVIYQWRIALLHSRKRGDVASHHALPRPRKAPTRFLQSLIAHIYNIMEKQGYDRRR
jgi:hypothetical protein